MAIGIALALVASVTGSLPLQIMTYADGEKTRTIGTGCSWKADADDVPYEWRMSMADDRAAVRMDGRLIVLSPIKGAEDRFPFTFYDWTDGLVIIRIREHGKAVSLGTDSTKGAFLTLTSGGMSQTWHGRISCGS